jgi:hypothetical protein
MCSMHKNWANLPQGAAQSEAPPGLQMGTLEKRLLSVRNNGQRRRVPSFPSSIPTILSPIQNAQFRADPSMKEGFTRHTALVPVNLPDQA